MKNRTITELYQALRPLLLRDVAGAAGGSGAAAGGMEAHALSSNWHTGTLAETQAPWAATKNEWATALATHAALVDVHHAAVTAGTLIALSGQQVGIATGAAYQFIGTGADTVPEWRNVAELAGNGLTAANGVLAVGVSGLGLSVGADAVALASSSNPGAAASILASDANGYLRLVRIGLGMAPTKPLSVSGDAGISGNVAAGSLSVTGAATVGQDFTVGANVLYVNQAGTRVGINRAPDQQFDLDVAGAIRGQYLIGRHAIQLSSAVGVWHYDGPAPYNLDFGGSDASHAGVGGTAAGGVIYRPGKFGKAVQMAATGANLLSNPSLETNTTGWSAWAGATLDRTSAHALVGGYALRITHVASTTSGATASYSTATQGTYTASAYVRSYVAADVGANVSILMRFTYSDASMEDVSANHALTDSWTRIEATATTNAAKTLSSITLMLRDLLAGAAHYTMVDAVQLENASFATPYCDGSLGTGHSWSGTAHASTSSRTAAQLTYATDGVSAQAGTVMAWIYPFRSAGTQTIVRAQGTTAGNIYLLISSGVLAGYWGTAEVAGTAVAAKAWTHVAMTYSGTTLTLYINGVQVASGTSSGFSGMPTSFHVGGLSGTNTLYGLIDEFVLTDYAMDAKLVRAIYESDAPVFVESSVFHWRSPSASPIWVDEYGLWARSVTGNEILGVYGGDPRRTATYRSWGGVNLEDNDVLIGRAAGGYMHWDDSAQTLSVQGTITALAGSIAGVLTIGASGEIRQGTVTSGTVNDAWPLTGFTGLRMWRESSIGRIGGYNANALQWYAGTDGKFYAGGGNVAVSASGIAIAPNYDSTSLTFTNVGEIYALYDAGFGGTLYLRAGYNRSKESNVLLEAYSGTTVKSSLGLGANGIISAVGAMGMIEVTAPSAPASNGAYLYLDDNGSGKTRLMVRFSSGSAVRLAIQP